MGRAALLAGGSLVVEVALGVCNKPPPPDEQERARISQKIDAALPIESWQAEPRPRMRLGRPGRGAIATLRRARPGETDKDRVYTTWVSISLAGTPRWILLEVRRGEGEGRGFDVKFDRHRHMELLEAIAVADRLIIADATGQLDQPLGASNTLRRVLDAAMDARNG